ncbi:MAG: BPL-N domain-containing protein [Parachlamydiaceae bacterium]
MKKKQIKIYCDKGVGRQSLSSFYHELSSFSLSLISSREMMETGWESTTDLIIIPGGRDLPYHQALKGEGNQRIRRYVENGGSYLGVCAGAYYGSKTVEFDRGMELEIVGSRELAFFPGIARGPAYGPGSFCYRSERGAKAALISNSFAMSRLRTYYNGGCYFVEAEAVPHVTIHSHYLEIEQQHAAIIEIEVGKGKAVLSGVHLEVSAFHPPVHVKQEMIEEITPYENMRRGLFLELIYRLLKINSPLEPVKSLLNTF